MCHLPASRRAAKPPWVADLRETDLTGAGFGSVNTGIPPFGLIDVTGARFEGAALRRVQTEDVIGWPFGGEGNA